MLTKEASSTIFWVFGMTRPGIEPRSSGPLANILTIKEHCINIQNENIVPNKCIWPINGTLTDPTTLQNTSFTIKCNLMQYPRYSIHLNVRLCMHINTHIYTSICINKSIAWLIWGVLKSSWQNQDRSN